MPTMRSASRSWGRSWRLRWVMGSTPTSTMASRVRQLMGWPSMTWVPAVLLRTPSAWAASMAPAITDRAAFPVQRKTTWGWASVTASGPSRGGERSSVETVDRREFLDRPAGQLAGLTHGPAHDDDGRHD